MPLNVLHIEDDYFDATLIEEMLNDGSYGQLINLSRVSSLKAAVKNLDENKGQYNVILLDLILGDMSGIRNVEILHEQCPEMPIVVLTGVDGDDYATKALRAGAQEYLVKAYESSHALKYAIKAAIQRKEYEKSLYEKINYDILSNLPNYRFLCEYLEREISRAKRWQKQVALMLVDIYEFGKVNDFLGYDNGNLVLKEVAKRIKSVLRGSDFVSRFGRDEFAVILDINDASLKTGCSQVAAKILNEMKNPIEIESKKIIVPVNIGFAFFPHNGDKAEDVLEEADKATYSAKQAGPNIYKFA